MMTSMGENGVASCLEVSTMKDYKCHEIASSQLSSPLEVNSATAYLLTKAALVLCPLENIQILCPGRNFTDCENECPGAR
jgi:hypothetical protein